MARKTERYNWEPTDFSISDNVDIPESLKSIVAKAPSGDQAIAKYLAGLVKENKITTDDVTFLIDSGVLT